MILGLIALAFIVLGTTLTYSRYRRDLSDARERLARGGHLVQTPCGAIEYSEEACPDDPSASDAIGCLCLSLGLPRNRAGIGRRLLCRRACSAAIRHPISRMHDCAGDGVGHQRCEPRGSTSRRPIEGSGAQYHALARASDDPADEHAQDRQLQRSRSLVRAGRVRSRANRSAYSGHPRHGRHIRADRSWANTPQHTSRTRGFA